MSYGAKGITEISKEAKSEVRWSVTIQVKVLKDSIVLSGHKAQISDKLQEKTQ